MACHPQVGRSSLLVGTLKQKYAQELLAEKLPPQDNATTTDSDMEEPYLQGSARHPGPPLAPRAPPGTPAAPLAPQHPLAWLLCPVGCCEPPPKRGEVEPLNAQLGAPP